MTLKETHSLLYETDQGMFATKTIDPALYPLVVEFASEQIRWQNGGKAPKLLMVQPND